jgi:cobalt-zinc-cadmium efflux system outer membrane protein
VRAAERGIERADSQVRLTTSETRRQAALEFVRLLGAQEQLAARRRALGEVERIRGLVAGRLESGMASRYDLARADAEASLGALAVQRAVSEASEHASLLAGLADAPGWRPRAAGSLQELRIQRSAPDLDAALERSPAVRVARNEAAVAEARVELAQRERYPVPSIGVGRAWTSGPFGAANSIGVTSEIPILDTRGAQKDKAQAEALAARQRARAAAAEFRAEYLRHADALEVRQAALSRLEVQGPDQQASFLGMAESAYRLGRGTLFELLEARRTQLDGEIARLELLGAIAESQIELRALGGEL